MTPNNCHGGASHDWDWSYSETGVLRCRICGLEHYDESLEARS